MYIHFSWKKFTFEAPEEITEAQYAVARERPGELRLLVRAQVRAVAWEAALPTIFAAAAAAGCFWLAGRFEFTNPRAWPAIIGSILVVLGVAMAFSAVFTAGSFLHYAAAVAGFWRTAIEAAQKCASYADFVTALAERQQAGIGVDRKLPWWVSWLILAGVLLVAYFGLSWFA